MRNPSIFQINQTFMGKKFIIVSGKKHYIDEKQLGDEDTNETPEEVETVAEQAADDAALGEEAQKAAKSMAATLKAELGIDDLKAAQERTEKYIEAAENSRLKTLLHGKDIVKDKDSLTAEEKIVGFFHALVTRNETAVKALSEGVAADGGNLFPTEFLNELVRPLVQPSRMRSIVRVITMRRNTLTAPSLTNRPKVYWTAENAAKTTTTANFSQVTLTARKVAAILYSSDELLEDSTDIDVVRLIIDLFGEAIAIEEDRVILRGNGTTEPTGIETARAAGTIATTSAAGANLSFDTLINLIYSLKPQYRQGSIFLVNPANIAELRKLKDTQGRYLWQDPSTDAGYASIYGYRVMEFYDVPESTIYFGNWSLAYWLGDRKSMTVKVTQDSETAFTKDQTGIRVVSRLAGNVVLGEAAKAINNIP